MDHTKDEHSAIKKEEMVECKKFVIEHVIKDLCKPKL